MTDKIREGFEKHFPAPVGVYWSEDRQKYLSDIGEYGYYNARGAEEHTRMLSVWKASREGVVIELPDHLGMPETTLEGDELYYLGIEATRDYLEHQGFKVT